MKNTGTLSKFTESTLSLCYLIGNTNGNMTHFETRMYEFIKHKENISEHVADLILNEIESMSHKYILERGVRALSQCEKPEQVKCLAWMNKIANADGYLGDQEWSIIYQVYNKELDITLEEILDFELPDPDYTFYMSQN
ncbi:MAG: hypothetical protein MI921_09930 [Cytophagales bacterium]|nr:hypothetical protein [Cytophagales bacterium]